MLAVSESAEVAVAGGPVGNATKGLSAGLREDLSEDLRPSADSRSQEVISMGGRAFECEREAARPRRHGLTVM